MPRYINEDDFCEYIRKNTTPSGAEWFISKIKDMPSEDVAEVKHGYWIVPKDEEETLVAGICFVCGWKSILYESDVVGMNYCPNCGANMRGDKDA